MFVEMKRHYYLLRSILVLIALCCTSVAVTGQKINSAAICTDDVTPQVVLKAKLSMPMAPRAGDVNLDGAVSITDVTTLIDLLLSGTASSSQSGDVNLDGAVTITDVTSLIDMLLGGETDYTYGKGLYDLNEIYASMRTAGWSTAGNTHQSFGVSAYNLMAEVMGDDMIMGSTGSGWFWFDAAYNVKTRYTSSSWRSYDLWNAYYTWVANANYILEAAKSLTGTEGNYIKGQAYAIRAYSYFMLAQSFARTYKGHESDPCVPLYRGLTFNGSTALARSTVAQVYAQIDADINQATTLLNGIEQMVPDHIGYAVAMGLKARIALVKEDWSTAYSAAVAAITASGKTIQEVEAFKGLNNAYAGNVMWGADIHTDEVGQYASLWAHMSADMGYGQSAPKQISNWLYNKMSATDARLAWWKDNTTGYGTDAKVQNKFNVVDGTEWEGDYIWMRVEEMYLTAAEAACRLNQTTNARSYLNQLMAKRDASYNCTKTGTELGALTTDETGSLLEEILIQRRIELWGEDGRIYTIRRLRQGFQRTEENGWPSDLLLSERSLSDPESYPWVLTIPMTEFVGNPLMNVNYDQNPLGDYANDSGIATGPQNVSFDQAVYHVTTAGSSINYSVGLTRSTTVGSYTVPIVLTSSNGLRASSYAIFADGQNKATATVTGEDFEFGNTYSCELSLTDYDINNGTAGRITGTRVEVKCENGNPAGQHISFESASYEKVASGSDASVWVTLTRKATQGEYRANLTMEDVVGNIRLIGDYVVFADGESTAQIEVYFYNTSQIDTYSCVLKLSDVDIANAIPGQPQIASTTVTVKGALTGDWVEAGSCTFTDYTWEESGYTAYNVPVLNMPGTNTYCIVSPLAQVYSSSYADGQGDTANWIFYLNDDGSISVPEGNSIYYWGYYACWKSNYPNYCYVTQDGNTYDVNFLLNNNGQLYRGGRFVFTWDR